MTVVAGICVALSLGAFWFAMHLERFSLEERFQRVAYDRVKSFRTEVRVNLEVLRSLGDYFNAVGTVTREEFHTFTAPVVKRRPTVQALEWIPHVPKAQRADYEERARRDGYSGFTFTERAHQGEMRPAGPRDAYFPVYFVEPFLGNEVAHGYDLASNAKRLEGLQRSRDTGELIATARITLVQETAKQYGFLVYLPIYRRGESIATEEDRRENLKGFVLGVFRAEHIVEEAVEHLHSDHSEHSDFPINFHLFDLSAPVEEQQLYPASAKVERYDDLLAGLHFAEPLEVGGRRWLIVVTPANFPGSAPTIFLPATVFAAGLCGTALLSLYLLAGIRRIEERYRAEEALRALKERFAGILEMAPEAIISVDGDQRIRMFNKGAEAVFGYTAEEVIGQPLDKLVPLRFRDTHAKHFDDFASSAESSRLFMARGHILGVRRDGNEFPAEASISKLKCGGETIFTVMLWDIGELVQRRAEQVELEQKLRQSQRMQSLGTLAGGIAHDFNNMLVPMLGLTELTKDDVPAESRAHANLEHVLEAGSRAKQLVDKILAFSRQDQAELKPLKLDLVISEALQLLRATLPATITICEDIADNSSTIMGDSTAIHQVLLNLAANAADAMGLKRGTLAVGLKNVRVDKKYSAVHPGSKPGRYVRLTVADMGCGMAEDTMEHAFDPFYTTKDVGEGTGMGLATVHGIVTNHGGMIIVASEPGQGTTFELYFPVCEEPVDAIPEGSARRPEAHDELVRAKRRPLSGGGLYRSQGRPPSGMANPVTSHSRATWPIMATELKGRRNKWHAY